MLGSSQAHISCQLTRTAIGLTAPLPKLVIIAKASAREKRYHNIGKIGSHARVVSISLGIATNDFTKLGELDFSIL